MISFVMLRMVTYMDCLHFVDAGSLDCTTFNLLFNNGFLTVTPRKNGDQVAQRPLGKLAPKGNAFGKKADAASNEKADVACFVCDESFRNSPLHMHRFMCKLCSDRKPNRGGRPRPCVVTRNAVSLEQEKAKETHSVTVQRCVPG